MSPSPVPGSPHRSLLRLEPLESRLVPAKFIAVGTESGVVAQVRIFTDRDGNGTYETLTATLRPFGTATTGVRVALGDFDGDRNDELVCASGPGAAAQVSIYQINSDGTVGTRLDSFFPWGKTFTGGLFVACGDLDNDGRDELAIGQASLGSRVAIYSDLNFDGRLRDNRIDTFAPFGSFRGGVRLAFGDTNNAGGDELIVGRGPGGPADVIIYSDSDVDRVVSEESPLERFRAFPVGYTGGIQLAAGPVWSGSGSGAQVFVGRERGPAVVKVYSDANSDGRVSDDPLLESFTVYRSFTGGVRLISGDTDDSGYLQELVVGPGPGGGRLVIRDDTNGSFGTTPPDDQFFPFGSSFRGGFFVAFGKVTQASYSAATTPLFLLDGNTTTASIFVPASAGIVRGLTVNLSFSHPRNADLDVFLVHVPSGRRIELFSDVGGTGAGISVTLIDGYPNIGTLTANQTIVGIYSAEGGSLGDAFNGVDASGEWRLEVIDDSWGQTGVLNAFTLRFAF